MKTFYREYKSLKQFANAYARHIGYGKADLICVEDIPIKGARIAGRINYGWRKFTTGEYVCNAYRAKGWHNTYYQRAHTAVAVDREIYEFFTRRSGAHGKNPQNERACRS